MAALGDIATIAHILKRAYALYDSCRAAPEEIYIAREHIHAMALCLEGVSSDLYANTRSFVHQTTAVAKTRQHALKVHVASCDRSLKRMEGLLETYQDFRKGHVNLWDRWRWSTGGKKEIAECKADLVMSTVVLDMFLSREQLNVLWRLESMIEELTKRIGALEASDAPGSAKGTGRIRSGSNVTRTIIVSLVLARLSKVLRSYRRKVANAKGKKSGEQTNPRRLKPAMRTNSGFKVNPKRNSLMQTYATNLASAAASRVPPHTPRKPRPRTPSPDFYYLSSTTPASPLASPVRRSSSMQQLTSRLNARIGNLPPPKEHYACWKVGIGTLALGLKTAPQFLRHKRGQLQLRKMGEVFKEAGLYDSRAITDGDKRVRLLLREQNKKVASGKKWYFVAGKVVARDPGRTGMVSVEKAFVVLVRR